MNSYFGLYRSAAIGLLLTAALVAQAPAGNARARKVLDDLAAGRFEQVTAALDANGKSQLPAERLKTLWGQVQGQLGNFKSFGETRLADTPAGRALVTPCQFERGELMMVIQFNPAGEMSTFRMMPKPPEAPAAPKPQGISERDIAFGSPEWQLPGTLTIPSGAGPFPAAVLIHGSGPHDRDETIGPFKPFRDLAWGLAERGVAVVRFEKRTRAHAKKMGGNLTLTVKDEVLDDAAAAIVLLARTKEVDPKRIYIVGHSLGGQLAPAIAVAAPSTAGIVMLAAPARRIEDLLVAQSAFLRKMAGNNPEAIKYMDTIDAAAAKLRALNTDTKEMILGAPSAYWLDLRRYDSMQEAAKLGRPILLLQGGRDYKVTMDDFALWKKGLAGKPKVTFRDYPSLTHEFVTGEGPGQVVKPVLDDIAAWIKTGSVPTLPAGKN